VGAHSWAREVALALKAEEFRTVLVDSSWANVREARMAGLPAYYGGIVSESVLDEIDLYGVGRLLALTPNDEANALAAVHFGDVFGRKEVYQLTPVRGELGDRKTLSPKHLSGRFAFSKDCTYSYLSQRFAEGYNLKTTSLTEKFDYQAFKSRYGEESIPLFVVDASGNLQVFAQDTQRRPRPGQTLISLIPPQQEEPAGKAAVEHAPAAT
jgi:hypothetical protein